MGLGRIELPTPGMSYRCSSTELKTQSRKENEGRDLASACQYIRGHGCGEVSACDAWIVMLSAGRAVARPLRKLVS